MYFAYTLLFSPVLHYIEHTAVGQVKQVWGVSNVRKQLLPSDQGVMIRIDSRPASVEQSDEGCNGSEAKIKQIIGSLDVLDRMPVNCKAKHLFLASGRTLQ